MKLTENKRGRYRHVDQKKFADNYDKIFGKKDKGEKNEGQKAFRLQHG